MRRFHEAGALIASRKRLCARVRADWPPRRPHNFYKRKPLDCGHPRCLWCHHEKLNGHEPTRQERAAEMRLREGD